MPTTYATVCDVGALIRTTFTCSTVPTTAQIESIINRMEERIDQRTGHTYGRLKTVTNCWQDMHLTYTFGWGTFSSLKHREIAVCATDGLHLCFTAGDRVEMWNGGSNSFDDITQSTGQYEVLAERGELYFRGYIFSILRKNRARITYRYGSATVPLDISDACIKMTCLDLIQGSFRMDVIPMGADGAKVMDTVGKWREDIDRVVRNREEVYIIP